MDLFPCDVRQLAELLQPVEEKNINGVENESTINQNTNKRPANNSFDDITHSSNKNNEKNKNEAACKLDETRLTPEVSFAYSQEVRPEDMFLGLGLRSPSSASCDRLRVTIHMPEEEAGTSDIDAQVECLSNTLEVRSPRYKLTHPFPHPVDPDTNSHRAQWNSDRRELTVTVGIRRELDYVNF